MWCSYQFCSYSCLLFSKKKTVKRRFKTHRKLYDWTIIGLLCGNSPQQRNIWSWWSYLLRISRAAWSREGLCVITDRNFSADYVHFSSKQRRDYICLRRGLGAFDCRYSVLLLPYVNHHLCRFSTHLHIINPSIILTVQLQGMIYSDIGNSGLYACFCLIAAQLLGAFISQLFFMKFLFPCMQKWKSKLSWFMSLLVTISKIFLFLPSLGNSLQEKTAVLSIKQ